MVNNYTPLAEFLIRFSPDTRQIIYEFLKRSLEYGFTDTPKPDILKKSVSHIEEVKGKW